MSSTHSWTRALVLRTTAACLSPWHMRECFANCKGVVCGGGGVRVCARQAVGVFNTAKNPLMGQIRMRARRRVAAHKPWTRACKLILTVRQGDSRKLTCPFTTSERRTFNARKTDVYMRVQTWEIKSVCTKIGMIHSHLDSYMSLFCCYVFTYSFSSAGYYVTVHGTAGVIYWSN